MSYYPSLPARASMEHLFKAFPRGARPLMELHDAILREDSELSIAERELIAAYVSSLNTCRSCFGAHKTMALAFGIPGETIDALIEDIETAPIDDRLRPLLSYAKKVTGGFTILPTDTRDVFEAGWSEAALHDVMMVTCLFNFMNRLVEGSGLSPQLSYNKPPSEAALKARRDSGYVDWGESAGFLEKTPT